MKKEKKLTAAELKKVKKVCDIICEELEKPLPLSLLASRVKMEPKYLVKCYKIHYCMTPREAILELKGAEGCQLILQNKLRLYEVAEQLGYATYQGFSRMFKKYTGLTPSLWQLMHLSVPGAFPWIFKPLFPSEET
jgi:AraC-like DNA-binding protein